MKPFLTLLLFLAMLAPATFSKPKDKSEVIAANELQAGLPRVLILGDSVCLGYTPPLAALLQGKANVFRTKKNGGSTLRGLENIDEWLGEGTWDVIHFNWGLQDMTTGPDGKLQAPPDVYEKNLRTLVGKLKATRAKLIWATITPIPKGFGDVLAYNEIAKRVMAENGVLIDDLNSAVAPHVAEYQLPQDVHYKPEGYALIAKTAAAAIEAALPVKK